MTRLRHVIGPRVVYACFDDGAEGLFLRLPRSGFDDDTSKDRRSLNRNRTMGARSPVGRAHPVHHVASIVPSSSVGVDEIAGHVARTEAAVGDSGGGRPGQFGGVGEVLARLRGQERRMTA